MLFSLLEIEREDDHLAVAAGDGIGVLAQVGVLQFAGMVLVEGIAKTVAELQLGDELEEGQIEIAAQSDFKEKVGALQLDILLILAREVDHRVDACHHVRTVVVPSLGTELDVEGKRDVGVLHVLRHLGGLAVGRQVGEVAEGEMLGAKMHGRREAHVQMVAQAQVGQHAYGETGIPTVGIAEDGLLLGGAVVEGDGLGTYITELDVLHVHAHQDTEVHGAQVDIGLMLDGTRLSLTREGQEQHACGDDNDSFHL